MTTLSKSFQSPHPILVAVLASVGATLVSYWVPAAHAGEAVGLVFLVSTYFACLRPGEPRPPLDYGLDLGGLFSPAPLRLGRMLHEMALAFLQATFIGLLILPLFWLGFMEWYHPHAAWSWKRAFADAGSGPAFGFLNLVLAHILVVALPEEAFFRGYLQTALSERYPSQLRILGLRLTLGLGLSSLIFALGHVTTSPDLGRLAVFFPSLLFGLLRDRTKGVGASIFLHAECNVFAAILGQGYGLY